MENKIILPSQREGSLHWIMREAAKKYGVTVKDLRDGNKRSSLLTAARWECVSAMRAKGRSLCDIGYYLSLDHTSVLHALRQREKPNTRVHRAKEAREAEIKAKQTLPPAPTTFTAKEKAAALFKPMGVK